MKSSHDQPRVYNIHLISALIIVLLLTAGVGYILYHNLNRIFLEQSKFFERNASYQKETFEKRFDSMSQQIERELVQHNRRMLKETASLEVEQVNQAQEQIERLIRTDIQNTLHMLSGALSKYISDVGDMRVNEEKFIKLSCPKDRFFIVLDEKGDIRHFCGGEEPKTDLNHEGLYEKYNVSGIVTTMKDKYESWIQYPFMVHDIEKAGQPALAQAVRLKETGWILCLGAYEQSFYNELTRNIRIHMNSLTNNEQFQSYTLIYELLDIEGGDAFARVVVDQQSPKNIGKLISSNEIDTHEYPYYSEMLKEIRLTGEAYIRSVEQRKAGHKPEEILTYYKILPEKNWIIARSVSLNQFIDKSIEDKERFREIVFGSDQQQRLLYDKETIYNLLRNDFYKLLLLLIGYTLTGILLFYVISRRTQRAYSLYRKNAMKQHEELSKVNRNMQQEFQQRVRAEREKAELERKTSALAMAVTASHEINQPLMILKGNLELFMMTIDLETLKPDQVKRLNNISGSLDRIQEILKKFHSADAIRFEEYSEGTQMVVFDQENPDSGKGEAK